MRNSVPALALLARGNDCVWAILINQTNAPVTETGFGANVIASVPVSAQPAFLRLGVSHS